MDDHSKQYISFKLGFLKKKAGGLQKTVDDFVAQILSTGKSWVDEDENVYSFEDINQLLESSIMFIGKKTKEISDVTTRKILTRIDVLEEAMASLRSTSQTVSTNQSHVQCQVEVFDVKLLKIEEEIDGMNKKQTELGKQQNQKVSEIEKEVKNVKTRQTEMGKQQDKRLKDIEKQLQTIASKQMEMDQEHSEKLKEMETEQTLAREEMNDIKSQIDDFDHRCESSDKKALEMKTKIDDLDHKCERFDKRAVDMKTKFEMTLCSIQELKRRRNEDLEGMKRIEEKTETVEDNLGKKYDEVDGNYNEVLAKLSELSQRTGHLKTISVEKPAGFTVEMEDDTTVEDGEVINSFIYIHSNEGNHYDPETGVFTAPQDGLYMASVTIEQKGDGEMYVGIRHFQSNIYTHSQENAVCTTRTYLNNTSNCCVGVVKMVRGDELYLEALYINGEVKFGCSSFSCCLLE